MVGFSIVMLVLGGVDGAILWDIRLRSTQKTQEAIVTTRMTTYIFRVRNPERNLSLAAGILVGGVDPRYDKFIDLLVLEKSRPGSKKESWKQPCEREV